MHHYFVLVRGPGMTRFRLGIAQSRWPYLVEPHPSWGCFGPRRTGGPGRRTVNTFSRWSMADKCSLRSVGTFLLPRSAKHCLFCKALVGSSSGSAVNFGSLQVWRIQNHAQKLCFWICLFCFSASPWLHQEIALALFHGTSIRRGLSVLRSATILARRMVRGANDYKAQGSGFHVSPPL